MKTLNDIKARLNVVLNQLENDVHLTGDMYTDYMQRKVTHELYCERNRLKRIAREDFNVSL